MTVDLLVWFCGASRLQRRHSRVHRPPRCQHLDCKKIWIFRFRGTNYFKVGITVADWMNCHARSSCVSSTWLACCNCLRGSWYRQNSSRPRNTLGQSPLDSIRPHGSSLSPCWRLNFVGFKARAHWHSLQTHISLVRTFRCGGIRGRPSDTESTGNIWLGAFEGQHSPLEILGGWWWLLLLLSKVV